MFIVDAHLDLSMNALDWNRDLTQPVQKIRERELGKTDKPDRGLNTVSFPELRKGNIGLVVGTMIARYVDEKNSLPGFDENEYAANSNGNARKWQDLIDEFVTVRKGTEIMFNSFTDEMLETSGISNNNPVTVKSLGFITLGHFNHHKKIIEERYL